jgi:hypothetical protein
MGTVRLHSRRLMSVSWVKTSVMGLDVYLAEFAIVCGCGCGCGYDCECCGGYDVASVVMHPKIRWSELKERQVV